MQQILQDLHSQQTWHTEKSRAAESLRSRSRLTTRPILLAHRKTSLSRVQTRRHAAPDSGIRGRRGALQRVEYQNAGKRQIEQGIKLAKVRPRCHFAARRVYALASLSDLIVCLILYSKFFIAFRITCRTRRRSFRKLFVPVARDSFAPACALSLAVAHAASLRVLCAAVAVLSQQRAAPLFCTPKTESVTRSVDVR